jgi:hypothetical protein
VVLAYLEERYYHSARKVITMFTVSLKMSEDLLSRLAAAASRRGVSRSAVVREALESYLDSNAGGKGTAAHRAADLIGSVEGPRDLSHNPEHMKGFGR